MTELLDNLFYIIGNVIINFFCLYFCYQVLDKKERIISKKSLLLILYLSTMGIIFDLIIPRPIRFVISFIFLIFIGYILADKNLIKGLVLIILMEVTMIVSDALFFISINVIIRTKKYKIINMISNVFVSLIGLIITKTKIPNKIYNTVIKSARVIRQKEIIINSAITVFILIFSTIESYIKIPIYIVIVTNTIIALIIVSIIVKFITAKSKYELISDKYQTSITSLKEYETMIDKFRVNTHENKNELLTIRNMVKNNDENVIEYIDALVDNKIKDNEKIMYQTSKIPEGGLRATIYSKLCVMDKYKINYKLDISKDVRTVDLINLDEELILNICKILGVFMDNAIKAIKNQRRKEIIIELYVIDNELYIDITNNIKGSIDLSKIGHERYTTKGKEHGYGLLLVNKIINENKKYLENENSINSNYFTQTLKIKI